MLKVPNSPDYDKNRYYGIPDSPCVVCGRPCPNPRFMLHYWDGGYAVTEQEAQALDRDDPGGDLGMYPIGSDCLRKHPELKPYVHDQKGSKS